MFINEGSHFSFKFMQLPGDYPQPGSYDYGKPGGLQFRTVIQIHRLLEAEAAGTDENHSTRLHEFLQQTETQFIFPP